MTQTNFIKANLLGFIHQGCNPKLAIEKVAVQLQTGDTEKDVSIVETVQEVWDEIRYKEPAEENSQRSLFDVVVAYGKKVQSYFKSHE